jgi:hypothetical protein
MMKNAFKPTAIFLILLSTLFACKKKIDDLTDFTIDDRNLTDCPQGTNCNFQYANYASMVGDQLTLTTGQYRIFWARNENNYSTSWLYFQAPMIGDNFLLNDTDVLAGRVKYVFACALCFAAVPKPVGGTVKGIRVAKHGNEPEKWLLESKIAIGAVGDTLRIKQYYYPAVQ